MKIVILIAALLAGCAENVERSGWFCWKPGSDLHEGPCVDACLWTPDDDTHCYCELGCFGIEEHG